MGSVCEAVGWIHQQGEENDGEDGFTNKRKEMMILSAET